MALHTKWSSGHLIFHDGTNDILEIKNGTDGVEFHQAVTNPDPATSTGSTGTVTLTSTSNRIQFLAATNDINLVLPTAAAANAGIEFKLFTSTATGAVTVKNGATGATVVTMAASEGAIVVSDGATWRGLVGANT